ncbi:hypothetical protein S1OALGB6SA_29 [Olavius algarvensis spirochete endosymbiont]|nr:hypothetical protein S1OALGB6SA_29 [Olavius algarvensis spirochete endosymbiont]
MGKLGDRRTVLGRPAREGESPVIEISESLCLLS